MFCSKCGNPLPDDAKFCSACGAPVKISQEASPVPQQPAGITDEAENIQTPKPEPLMQEPNFNANQGLNFPKSNGKHCERNAAKDMQEQALRRAHFGSGLNICQVTKPIEERFDGLPHRAYKCRHGIPSE